MDNIWPILLSSLIGIIPGTLALIGLWKLRKTQAERTDAERKDIEDQITERVLERARKEINGLTLENEKVTKELETVKKDRVKLTGRVRELEARCRKMQAKHESLEQMVESLKDGIMLLCQQLSDAGVEPVFVLEDTNEGD